MNNVIPFLKMNDQSGKSHIAATPDGIIFLAQNNESTVRFPQLLGYSSAILQLDEGEFDTSLHDGLRVIAEIQLAEANGWFNASDEQKVMIWRWIVACLFICEEWDRNGIADVENESHGTGRAVIYSGKYGEMEIYPSTERCFLASNMESGGLDKYGVESSVKRTWQLYLCMVKADTDGGSLGLSEWGRDALAALHDDLIQTLNNEGSPEQPAWHQVGTMGLIANGTSLDALAQQYSEAVYSHVTQQKNGNKFDFGMDGEVLYIATNGGVLGIRNVVDSYLLDILKLDYPRWEPLAIALLTKCLDGNSLTLRGLNIWEGTKKNMWADVLYNGGLHDA
ncbi:hypothetical protein [Serratia liquefaciens]|uniref:Uncharacterized protein n=1 Tax=Serratia liquefaciens TaxID=614 RepID=A0A515CQM2_SERLI|nr:hypothetical protein [Serratia liquefaciens]QDL30420.1 hypothetical protein EGO53_00795 [Serratia liquefaciens]